MDDLIEVSLSSPAKVGARVLMAGVHRVSPAENEALCAAGVVAVSGDGVTAADVLRVEIGTPQDTLLARLDEADRMVSVERQNVADLTEKLTAAHAELEALKAAAGAEKLTIAMPPVAKNTPRQIIAKKGAATS